MADPGATPEEQMAAAWLDAFESAVSTFDVSAVEELFLSESHWRDFVAFTWDVRTYNGVEEIAAGLAGSLPKVEPSGFRLDESRTPPRRIERAGVSTVEAFFEFSTLHGRGAGVLRLRDEDGPKAWILLTTLQELEGVKEAVGEHRPQGEIYARNFGGDNWLDQRQAAVRYDDREPEVLVVGGGQAGLSIAARLGRLDIDTLVVDRGERVGDVWRTRYHALTLHNQVWVTHLPYMPFPDTFPTYVPKDKLANWFEAYADAMEINFWTSTEFVGGQYDEAEERWTVTVRREGTERVLRPKHVVMATGVSGLPNMPSIPGLEDFEGEVFHSGAHTSGKNYRGKRAVIFGTGNSAHDVAQDLYSAGAEVTMVQRNSTTIVDLDTGQGVYALYSEGIPNRDTDLLIGAVPYPVLRRSYQLITEQMREADAELLEKLEAAGFRLDWGEDETGFQMKYLRRGGGYYINVGCSDLIIEGKIGLVQYDDFDRLTTDGMLMGDGTKVPADIVVMATGYKGQQELVRQFFGDEVADKVGPVWGIDDGGEMANMWKRTPQKGLWFHGGSLTQARVFSKFLALQILASERGIIEPVVDESAR